MKFSETLAGADLSISDDKLHASRKDVVDSLNSKTLLLQSQPITIKNQQSYVLDLDMKIMGFGKIGVMTQNPLNINISQCTALGMLKDANKQDQNCMVTEFPLYDTESRKLFESQLLSDTSEIVQLHLLLLLDNEGSVHYFINFEHRGTLFVGLELKFSWWLFFDLNGCLKSLTATSFNGAPDSCLFDDEEGFKLYYKECSRRSRLCYQGTMVILQLSESDETVNEILDLSAETSVRRTKVQLKAKCDFRSGQIVPDGWNNTTVSDNSLPKDTEQGFIGGSDTSFSRESTDVGLRHNHNLLIKDKIELFEAEKYAELVLKKIKRKDDEIESKKTSEGNDINFTDLSLPLPIVKETTDLSSIPNLEAVPLVESLMTLFLEINCVDIGSSREKCKDTSKGNGTVQRTYSSDSRDLKSMSSNIELEVELITYRSMVQFQILQCIGVRDPGIYMVIFDIDQYLISVDSQNLSDLTRKVEEWLWLLYQRGPRQIAKNSVVIVMCYTKTTLDYITSEKMVHNIQFIKKLVTESCSRHEYSSIVKGEPTVLGPSSTNRAEKIFEVKKNILNLLVNSTNVARLVPESWFRSVNILRHLSLQETKILSFGQVCKIMESQCNTDMDNVTRCLEYLSNLGLVPWIGDKRCHLNERSELPSGSRIMEEQASVIITDKEWLRTTILELECNKRKDLTFSEKIDDVLKSFSYHKLIFILMLKFPSLAVEDLTNNCLLTIFDYPLQSLTSFFSQLSEKSHDNELTIYFILNQPFPWVYYISLLLACIKMSSNYHIQPLKTSSAMQNFHLEDDYELDIFRLSETVIAANISCESPFRAKSNVIARVRQFIEQHIYHLSITSSHRLTVRAAVRCSCNAVCTNHTKPRCADEYSCLHFQHLDEVLCNDVVFCGPRRIPTAPWRDLFPPIIPNCVTHNSKSCILPSSVSNDYENHSEDNLPGWIAKISKVLNIDDSGFNWKTLAMKLGYKDNIKNFQEERNPSMELLLDWITTSGNSQLSIDFLILTLQEAGQYQISDIIEADPDCQNTQPQIFISYQWHSQLEAKNIAEYLNEDGFATWMDVGQMGGGDLLMHRIERAIRCCKVLVACITPRYVVSSFCHRELLLADLLKKPIIPVMLSSVPWPPPGGTGLLLAPYVYIDMFGVGGHGGSGLKSDLASRYVEIKTQISKYCISSSESQRHSVMKKVPIQQTINEPPPRVINGVHHSPLPQSMTQQQQQHPLEQPQPQPQINTQQSNVITSHVMPVPSQTSVRECSSVCTII